MNQHNAATNHPFAGDYNHHDMQMNVNNNNDNGEYSMMMMNNDDDLLAFSSSSSSHAGASSMHGVEDGGNDANNNNNNKTGTTNADSSILDSMSNANPTSDHHNFLDSDKGNEEDGAMGREEEEENDGDIDNANHGAFTEKESQDDNDIDAEEIDETWTRWKDDAGKKLQSALEDYKGHTKRLFTEIESYITKLASVDKSYAGVQQSENAETSRLDQVAPDVEGATGPVLNHHHHQQQRHHHD